MTRRKAGVLLVVGGLVVGGVAWARWAQPPPPRQVGATRADTLPPAPAARGRFAEGDDTEAGARATAIADITDSQAWLSLDDAQVDQQVRAIATPGAGAALAAQTVEAMRASRQALSASVGTVWWLVCPLAYRIEHFDPSAARVDIWVVTVLSAPGVAAPQSNWSRVGVDLSFLGGSWKLASISQSPGPTPSQGSDAPSQPSALSAALGGYTPLATEVP